MTEALVAVPVECEPLEAPADVEAPGAPPLQYVHAVVEPLPKSAGQPTLAVVGDRFTPPIDRPQSALARSQAGGTHSRAPRPDRTLGPCLRVIAHEQCCPVFPQEVGGLDLGREWS
jgi:hypothetical protein